jgi:hypothetical protein
MSTITYQIPHSTGKFLRGADPNPAEVSRGAFSGIIYRISHREIEAADIGRFLHHFGENTDKHWLRQHRNNVRFSLDGYSEDQREIYEIPEIRAYYSHLNDGIPTWSFFGDLTTPNLIAVVACMASIRSIRKTPDSVLVTIDTAEVHYLLTRSLPSAAMLYHFSGIAPKSAVRRLQQVAAYLGFNGG